METFTYMDAIRKLLIGDGLDSNTEMLSKVCAVLLVIFSGIWPHLKLILLHFCWFFKFRHYHGTRTRDGDYDYHEGGDQQQQQQRRCSDKGYASSMCCSNGRLYKSHSIRSPFLRILSIFGKWSLADVLVVCILIAVLHLDWNVNVDSIRNGVEEKLPTILNFVQNVSLIGFQVFRCI